MTKSTTRPILTVMTILSYVSISIGQSSLYTKKISIRLENKPLRYVLEEINKKSNVEFIFDDRLIDGKIVTNDVENKTVGETLNQILPEAGLAFREVQKRWIVLYKSSLQYLRCRITGRVIDAYTREPLFFANVFLSNTTRGCATDKNGFFSIYKVPPGNYKLVASMMGYELQVIPIRLHEQTLYQYHIPLKPKPIEAPLLEVTALHPREWKKILKRFKRYLLGMNSNASRSEILNPEVLDFDLNQQTNELKASASEPLQIENRALGYRIHCYLQHFHFKNYFGGKYTHESRFELLPPKNKREAQKWEKKRLESYFGSKRHFIKSLYFGRVEKEGFLIYNLPYFFVHWDILSSYKIVENTLLMPGELPFEKNIDFSNNLLVIYTKDKEPRDYTFLYGQSNHFWKFGQTTWFRMNMESVSIDSSGQVYNLYNPYPLQTYGYMTWERIADVLPLDYVPPVRSKD